MPHFRPRIVQAAASQDERRRRRAGIRLRDYSITIKTKERYEKALGLLIPFLEKHPDLTFLDDILCEWIEMQWARGESLGIIADSLSGLHFFWPHCRGSLRQAWRMFKNWRRIESPERAPPLTAVLARAFVARAVHLNLFSLATLIAVGFHGLLRTGELLALRFQDLEFSSETGVISLPISKSGLRTGAAEAVAIRDPLTLNFLLTLAHLRNPYPGDFLWTTSAQHFRDQFRDLCNFFQLSSLSFKPYSLRRGGATYLLQSGLPMATILLRGRWRSVAVASLYLQDGMAQIPALRLPATAQDRVSFWSTQVSPTAFQPC